ncbi:hypothetical protein V565_131660 [Rhizoctonia solani 123E]|uniref:Uncharacterized protein n=1 Tax=Rhizoctonia solani 123E TaxID=1423351 RepID=A0A074RMW6_9AGAM|nr:hypothetical protein V565_131660 [Rhizoctonia solani 123E]
MSVKPSKPPKRTVEESFAQSETSRKRPKRLKVKNQDSPSQESVQPNRSSSPSTDDINEPDEAEATRALFKQAEKNPTLQPNELRLSELMDKHRIGGAYVRAFPSGHVRGVVNLSEHPNARGNIRPLDHMHVENLYRAFTTPGAKSDHSSPIFLAMDSSTIDPECLKQMRACDPRNPTAELPLLTLNHPTFSQQQQMEEWIRTQWRDGSWLSELELRELQQELETSRAENPLALLLNGFHRIHTIEKVAEDLMNRHRNITRRIRAEGISIEEFETRNQEIANDSFLANYRVEVYEGILIFMHDSAYIYISSHIVAGLPDELMNWLVRNDDPRPVKGMGVGEKTWLNGEKILVGIKQAQDEGYASRAMQLEHAYKTWAKEVAPNRFIKGSSKKPTNKPALTAHLKAEWAGDDPISRLFTEPFTLEMILDTRHAVNIYADILSPKLTTGMLHPFGALLACRFWLSTRILMEIFNVYGAEGLGEAERFIGQNQLSFLGSPGATYHWDRLHARPQRTPALLEYFTRDAITVFDRRYESVWQLDHDTRGTQWSEESVVIAARKAFEGLGEWYGTQTTPWAKVISLSFRLYARLPLAKSESSGACFYPAGALPTPGVLQKELKRAKSYHYPRSLAVLEYLLDEYSPTWTIGSQPLSAAHNAQGWHLRPRGLHQIAMAFTMGLSGGSLSNKLQSAIFALSDSRLYNALKIVSDRFADRLAELEIRCNIGRSQNLTYDILSDYPPEILEAHGGVKGLFEKFKRARNFLRSEGTNEQLTPCLIDRLYSEHPILSDLIDKPFWAGVDATQWLLGWNTSETRRFRNLNALFGWGMYCKRIRSLVDEALWYKPVPHLLQICLEVAQGQDREPWWSNKIPYNPNDAPGFDSPTPTLDNTCKSEEEDVVPQWGPTPPILSPPSPTPSPRIRNSTLASGTLLPHALDRGVSVESTLPLPHSSKSPVINRNSQAVGLKLPQEHTLPCRTDNVVPPTMQSNPGASASRVVAVAYSKETLNGCPSVQSMELNPGACARQSLRDLLSLEETQKTIRGNISIPGLLVHGFVSDKLLPGYHGQHVFRSLHDAQTTEQLINNATARTKEALEKLETLRSETRTQFLGSITNLATGAIFLMLCLEVLLMHAYIQLSYVRMAAVCIAAVGVPQDDALAEAILMATCDKVFKDHSFQWTEDGDLILDASWTFPGGVVNHPSRGKLLVGRIEHPPENLLESLDSYPTLSPKCIAQPSHAIETVHAANAGPLQSHAFDQGSIVTCYNSQPCTFQSQISCFSGGPFCLQFPWLALVGSPSDAEGVLKRLIDAEKVLNVLREEKKKAALEDWVSRLGIKGRESTGLQPVMRPATSWGCNYM